MAHRYNPHRGETGGTQGVFTFSDGSTDTWTLRRSNRARNIRVKMSPTEGIVIAVPPYVACNPQRTLEGSRDWLEQHHAAMAQARAEYLRELEEPLPTMVEFPTAGERWKVVYTSTQNPTVARHVTQRQDGDLTGTCWLSGAVEDRALCYEALRRFTFARARVALPELLSATAEELDVHYASCRVSNARSRWGSCSSRGVIMLSSNCLFLPPELSYHIMCHELTHISQMNHSPAFHEELDEKDEASAQHARALREAGSHIPAWMN